MPATSGMARGVSSTIHLPSGAWATISLSPPSPANSLPSGDELKCTDQELRSRIFNFLEKAKTAKSSIDYTFSLDESIKETKLSSLQGINIYRTIQEAVNNAIKYAEAKKIVIEAKTDGKNIIIEIRDNGVGFDTTVNDRGNGLGNMKKRMKEIGAEFEIKSGKQEGTAVTISFQNKNDNA